MKTTDIAIVGGLALLVFFLWPRKAAPANPLAGVIWGDGIGSLLEPVPSVTTEEFYTLPYYLDINSGLFNTPAPLQNQNVSRGIS